MLAKLKTFFLVGIEALPVEVDVSPPGLPKQVHLGMNTRKSGRQKGGNTVWVMMLVGISLVANLVGCTDAAMKAFNKGAAFRDKGDNDAAITAYTEAIRLNPNFAEAFYGRGLAYGDKGDLEEKISDCTEAIRLKPKFA